MQLFNILTVSALASLALADNTVTFVNQDATNRTIIFTAQVGKATMKPLVVGGYESKLATFSYGWAGNYFSINTEGGSSNNPGMLGEFTWNTWGGMTFFDVSAIVNPSDTNGVKEIFPKNSNEPLAGCQEFPCDNAYNVWNDDLATKATTETDFVCLLGTLETQRRRGANANQKMKRVAPLTGEAAQQ